MGSKLGKCFQIVPFLATHHKYHENRRLRRFLIAGGDILSNVDEKKRQVGQQLQQEQEQKCAICEIYLKSMCKVSKDPNICTIYEDYATGNISGEDAFKETLKHNGPTVMKRARRYMIKNNLLPLQTFRPEVIKNEKLDKIKRNSSKVES